MMGCTEDWIYTLQRGDVSLKVVLYCQLLPTLCKTFASSKHSLAGFSLLIYESHKIPWRDDVEIEWHDKCDNSFHSRTYHANIMQRHSYWVVGLPFLSLAKKEIRAKNSSSKGNLFSKQRESTLEERNRAGCSESCLGFLERKSQKQKRWDSWAL